MKKKNEWTIERFPFLTNDLKRGLVIVSIQNNDTATLITIEWHGKDGKSCKRITSLNMQHIPKRDKELVYKRHTIFSSIIQPIRNIFWPCQARKCVFEHSKGMQQMHNNKNYNPLLNCPIYLIIRATSIWPQPASTLHLHIYAWVDIIAISLIWSGLPRLSFCIVYIIIDKAAEIMSYNIVMLEWNPLHYLRVRLRLLLLMTI